MTIRADPEANEVRALFDLVDFDGRHVLEIGCGDGRLTWRYADRPTSVMAIDPYSVAVERGKNDMPDHLSEKVEMRSIPFLEFAESAQVGAFDIVLLSWSLC